MLIAFNVSHQRFLRERLSTVAAWLCVMC